MQNSKNITRATTYFAPKSLSDIFLYDRMIRLWQLPRFVIPPLVTHVYDIYIYIYIYIYIRNTSFVIHAILLHIYLPYNYVYNYHYFPPPVNYLICWVQWQRHKRRDITCSVPGLARRKRNAARAQSY